MPARHDRSDDMTILGAASVSLRGFLGRYFRQRVRDSAEVEDLVQEVFTRIVSRDSPEPVKSLGGYALQTAANVLKDRAKRRTARRAADHIEFDPAEHGETDFAPDRIIAGREDLQKAAQVLLSLPERTRTILILHRLEGLRQKEIGQRLGISVSAVEKHLVRALDKLCASFEEDA